MAIKNKNIFAKPTVFRDEPPMQDGKFSKDGGDGISERDSFDERESFDSPQLKRKRRNARERYKFTVPDSCKLEMQKLNGIEELDLDFLLAAHPYP